MDTLRLSTKGQIVIPKEIRSRHQWEPGTELILEDHGDVLVLRKAKPFPPTRVEDGLGCTGYRGPAKKIEDMDATVAAAFRHNWEKSRAE